MKTGVKRKAAKKTVKTTRPKVATPLGLKYIKRKVCCCTRGWAVVFLPRHKMASRFWSDRKCGGEKIALAKALQWRDQMIRKHRIPATPRRLPVPWKRCSPSGVRGVYLSTRKQAYVAQIAEAPGHYPRAYFGFATHGGKRKALVAAVRHRLANEMRVYGTIVSPLPAWLAAEVGGQRRVKATKLARGRR